MSQFRGQQVGEAAARPRGPPAFGLLRCFLHDGQVVIRSVPTRTLAVERTSAARWLPRRPAGWPRSRTVRHQGPPQEEHLVLAHLGHLDLLPSALPWQGPLAVSRRSGAPLRLTSRYRAWRAGACSLLTRSADSRNGQ